MAIKTLVFDLGGVLIDWNPHYLYKKIFDDEEEMAWFLENICTSEWNLKLDKGYPFEKAVTELKNKYPEYEEPIIAYHKRWQEMLGDEIHDCVAIMDELQKKEYPVYGLTNWSAETFPIAQKRYNFLKNFDGIVVSGNEKLVKPDIGLYQVLINRYHIKPEESLFIDDKKENVESARQLGFFGITFTSSDVLRRQLKSFNIL